MLIGSHRLTDLLNCADITRQLFHKRRSHEKHWYTLFFNKNKLNKNIEAEIARKIRTIKEQSETEIFFNKQTSVRDDSVKLMILFEIQGLYYAVFL